MRYDHAGYFLLSVAVIFELAHSIIAAYCFANMKMNSYSLFYDNSASHLTNWAVFIGLAGLGLLYKAHIENNKGNFRH